MWIIARYMPSAIFSLKPATATSSGGKTLICPTPFAIKMALLDSVLRTQSIADGKRLWPAIRDLQIKTALPDHIAVINTFTKIVRPKKNGPSDDHGLGLMTPFGSTIAYREYVSYSGTLNIAVRAASDVLPDLLLNAFYQVNYLGKRGSFLQLLSSPEQVEDAIITSEHGWISLTDDQSSFAFDGTLQLLDDCGPKLTFDQVDIYSGKRMTLGKDRILRHVVLPYRLTRSSRGFSLYERIER